MYSNLNHPHTHTYKVNSPSRTAVHQRRVGSPDKYDNYLSQTHHALPAAIYKITEPARYGQRSIVTPVQQQSTNEVFLLPATLVSSPVVKRRSQSPSNVYEFQVDPYYMASPPPMIQSPQRQGYNYQYDQHLNQPPRDPTAQQSLLYARPPYNIDPLPDKTIIPTRNHSKDYISQIERYRNQSKTLRNSQNASPVRNNQYQPSYVKSQPAIYQF